MAENSLSARRVFMFPAIFAAVLALHVLFIAINITLPEFGLLDFKKMAMTSAMAPIKLDTIKYDENKIDEVKFDKIRQVKTQAVKHSQIKTDQAIFDAGTGAKRTVRAKNQPKDKVSLAALGGGTQNVAVEKIETAPPKVQRPGSRPEAFPNTPKAMNAISLKSQEFKNYSKSFPSGGLRISDMMAGAQKISDAVVSIEVPEGVDPDELNEYELMFYGFQKRTSVNYVNSILKNLDKFIKTHPNYRVQTQGRITMTARISYDKEGNVKQIKMIRWTHEQPMQDLFEDIVKNIDQLHNPPKTLWEKNDEFAMFFTLEIVNG